MFAAGPRFNYPRETWIKARTDSHHQFKWLISVWLKPNHLKTSNYLGKNNPAHLNIDASNIEKMRSKFKDEHPFEKRKAEAERIRQKYADRIPVRLSMLSLISTSCGSKGWFESHWQVICEKVEKSDIATIDKKKYLVPADLTVGQFVYVIRKRIKLSPEKAIFIFVDEVLPPTAALMSSIYEEHKDEDGFLYITWVATHHSLWYRELRSIADTLAKTLSVWRPELSKAMGVYRATWCNEGTMR